MTFLRDQDIDPNTVSVNLSLADSSKCSVTEAYEFDCTIQGIDLNLRALFVSGLTTPIILGMDALQSPDLRSLLFDNIGNVKADIFQSCEPEVVALAPLSMNEEDKLATFLKDELEKFESVSGRTTLVKHKIRLKVETPIKQRYYPRNPAVQAVIDEEIDKMLANDVIEPSESPWSSPLVLIRKPGGKVRLCIDLRKVNQVSEKDAYPLPQIGAILDKLRYAKYITTLDLKSGYWQIPLENESKPITAFTIPGRGLFQFKVMPFGLHSAPATFQRLLDSIIGPEFEPFAFAYLDDLILVSKSFSEHIALMNEVFKRLRDAGLVLNVEKCNFCKKELKYLGHIVNEFGIQTDPEKVQSIVDFPKPKTVKDIRSFIGLASWYRRFIENFATIAAPLTQLTKKTTRWTWNERQERAFESLKTKLSTAPILTCPDFERTFVLQVDASNEGLGAALTQFNGKKENVIAFASRLLTDHEKRFTTTEKECLSLVWSVKKFRPYLEGYSFIAITDHQALKWLMNLEKPSGRLGRWILELQQYDFSIQYRTGKLNSVADALSRYPVSGLKNNLSNEMIHSSFTTTDVNICAVSKDKVTNDNTPRVQDKPTKPEKSQRTGENWYSKLYKKVEKHPEKYPNFRIQNMELFRQVRAKRGKLALDPTTVIKKCVPLELRKNVLEECHDRPTAGHLGINKTLTRISNHYFWPNLRNDVKQYVRSCETCQRFKVEQRPTVGKMFFRSPRGPWYTVTSDIIGPLPRSKRGHRFIIVFQDSYSKWVELAPLKNATAREVSKMFVELIMLRFGSPEVVLTDNGTQYVSKIFQNLAKDWGFKHQVTAPYSPQSNPTERANRVIKTMVSQYVKDDHRMWDEHLNEFRFALNTAVHESTKYTPAALNFCRELRSPQALHGPLAVNTNESESSVSDTHDMRFQTLKDIQAKVQENLEKAFQQQSKYYNLRHRENHFKIGQQVLRKTHVKSSAVDYVAGKLAPKFEGPFEIEGFIGANIVQLKTPKGKPIGRSHVKDLKSFIPPP